MAQSGGSEMTEDAAKAGGGTSHGGPMLESSDAALIGADV